MTVIEKEVGYGGKGICRQLVSAVIMSHGIMLDKEIKGIKLKA